MEALLNTAIAARKGIIPADTDAYRLFDGIGDGRDGVFVDQFAGRWLVSFRGPRPEGIESCDAARSALWFKRLEREDKQPPDCIEGDPGDASFEVVENGIRFHIDFDAGYSQGLFLDQRDNRRAVRLRSPGARVLNAFSYTCGFSVAAALGGAESTTSLDLSRGYLDWGRRNFGLNGLDPDAEAHHFCRGEAFQWLAQFARKRRRFGGVILDPPSFSRSGQGGVFRAEKDYGALVEAAAGLLLPGGWLLACCNQRGLPERAFVAMVRSGLGAAGRRPASLETRPMPPDFTGEPYLKSVWVDLA